jgi:hypothetical protein
VQKLKAVDIGIDTKSFLNTLDLWRPAQGPLHQIHHSNLGPTPGESPVSDEPLGQEITPAEKQSQANAWTGVCTEAGKQKNHMTHFPKFCTECDILSVCSILWNARNVVARALQQANTSALHDAAISGYNNDS